MIIITGDLSDYRDRIIRFLDGLDCEKKYFHLSIERVESWEYVLLEQDGDKIIAVAGLEKKLWITRNILMVKQEHQGRGLGGRLLGKLLDHAKGRHALVMAVIKDENQPSINLHRRFGYKAVGNHATLCYLIMPLNTCGALSCWLVQRFFPLIGLVDRLRR